MVASGGNQASLQRLVDPMVEELAVEIAKRASGGLTQQLGTILRNLCCDSEPTNVTERDLRAPEWRDCDPAELEWRQDGTLARRDRWERGIREIAGIVGVDPRANWEIADVVALVKELVAKTEAGPALPKRKRGVR